MSRRREFENLQVPLAAMIDITFQLLLFFIFSWHETKTEAHLAINMPAPSSVVTKEKPKLLEVYILPDRYLWMGTKEVQIDKLQDLLISAASFDAEMTVLIKVHMEAPEKKLVDLLDKCAYAGLQKLNVMTLKAEFGP